jgi:hypothetical protein
VINIETCSTGLCPDSPDGETHVIIIEGCLGDICEPIECEIVIYNPCLNPDLYTIMPVDIPQIQYTLFQDGVYHHDPFTVDASEQMIAMCGGLTYVVECNDLEIFITYDVELHVISIYCDDMDLLSLGTVTYSINVFLTEYPVSCGACVGCCGSSTNTIVIVDPCLSCQITPDDPTNILVVYGNVGTFYYPTVTVDPPICEGGSVHYTCAYVEGPYPVNGGINLCNFDLNQGGHSCHASFDPLTGVYEFECTDTATFPVGQYYFEITAHIGTLTSTVTITMAVASNCPVVHPQIMNEPFRFGPYYYELGQPLPLSLSYDVGAIGNVHTSATCGSPGIRFKSGSGDVNLDAIITIDTINSKVLVGPTENIGKAGDYLIMFEYFNSLNPQAYVVSELIKLTVVDPCNPPASYPHQVKLIPPQMSPEPYTISAPEYLYEVPAWATVPVQCAARIPYETQEVLRGSKGLAATFDGSHLKIHYDGALDLTNGHVDGATFTVSIAVDLHGLTSTTSFNIVMKNPCLNTDFVTVGGKDSLSEIHYELGDMENNMFVHDSFRVNGAAGALCGPLHYQALLGDLAPFVNYSPSNKMFTIVADSPALIDNSPYTYTVKAQFLNYVGYGVNVQTS